MADNVIDVNFEKITKPSELLEVCKETLRSEQGDKVFILGKDLDGASIIACNYDLSELSDRQALIYALDQAKFSVQTAIMQGDFPE